jgi:hypothetical protein
MKSGSRSVSAVFLFFSFVIPASRGQEPPAATDSPVPLRWHLAAGDQFVVAFSQKMQTISAIGNRALRMQVEMGAELLWKVEDVQASGDMRIEQTISRLQMRLTRSDGTDPIQYDSAATERPRGPARDIAAAVKPLVGTTSTLTMNPRGEILSAQLSPDTEEALEELKDSEQVLHLFSAEGLSEVLRQVMPMLPAEPVTAGQTWEVAHKTTLAAGVVAQTTQLTYRGPEEKDGRTLQRIDQTATSKLQPPPEAAEAGAKKITVKEQKLSGTVWFDSQAGRFDSGALTQELVTESPYRDETITVRLTSELTFTVTP